MLKKIIGFFKKPQPVVVVEVTPYKVETPVAPVVAAITKKVRKPAVKKVAVPLRKASDPKPPAKKPAGPKKTPAKKPAK